MNLVGRRQGELVLRAAGDQVIGEFAFLVQGRVRLRDHVLAFFDGRQVVDLIGHLAVGNAPDTESRGIRNRWCAHTRPMN